MSKKNCSCCFWRTPEDGFKTCQHCRDKSKRIDAEHRIICECGGKYIQRRPTDDNHKLKHEKTKKHQKWLLEQIE